MTPRQRIRRIQSWLTASDGDGLPFCFQVHESHLHPIEHDGVDLRYSNRCTQADRLFAAELAWLCEYSMAFSELLRIGLNVEYKSNKQWADAVEDALESAREHANPLGAKP